MRAHEITVASPRGLEPQSAPYLVQRDDPDFVGAVLAELPTQEGRARLASSRAQARDASHVLKLYQPIQRRFHLALVEAWCETAGYPRLDPAKVEAAGMVLRRVRGSGAHLTLEGWMRAQGTLRGWLPVDRLGHGSADPSPAVRAAARRTGVASLDRALLSLDAAGDASVLEEDVVPMFVAPPQVCASAGATVYYGVVPTASAELAQTEPDLASVFEGFDADSAAFRDHLVQPLRGDRYDLPQPPLPQRGFDASWLEELLEAPVGSAPRRFLQLLRQVAVEFDAFGPGEASRRLLERLDDIPLQYALRDGETRPRTVSAGAFLSEASRILLEGESGVAEMPQTWPERPADASSALAGAMSDAMRARFKTVRGRPGRFDEPDAQYVLRAFVRLRGDHDCPPKTVWTEYTEPFVIAPWHESAGDPVQVALPDLTDRNVMRGLKPNVAFTLPPALQNLLGGSAKDLMEGKGSSGSGGVGWICSFSLPVITFCAFIVLNIFLSLFDLIFRWMLFIKICIPYPKAK